MKVLVACESSGTVRDAFLRLGHDAMSCDLLPSETPGPHYQGDARDILEKGWDLLIAHPPCTYLAKSGVRWLHTDVDRWEAMIDGAVLFRAFLEAPVPRIAVENPIMHRYARKIVGRRHTQIVHPHEYGHDKTKATALWLAGLPPLLVESDGKAVTFAQDTYARSGVLAYSPGPDRWKHRSKTYSGIAAAMAAQWGES